MISSRVRSTQSPPLVELGKLASAQSDCISLGQGAPYYSPSIQFINEFYENLGSDIHRYTTDPGILPLRKAITKKLQKDQHISVDPEQVVVTPGANQAFYNCLLTITDPGDEIILLSPYYFNHYMACQSLNVIPVVVPLISDFSPDLSTIKASMSSKTRAIVIVNPGNPTGMVFSNVDLKSIIDLALDNQILIIADETYEYFTYNRPHIPVASLADSHVISLSSFSKTFGIPGWRLGYYIASQDIIDASIKIQDTTAICAPHISQQLGITLLDQRDQLIPGFVKIMEQNHRVAVDLLEEVEWLDYRPSHGAYYVFPKQTTGVNTTKLVRQLIHEAGVYIVPGGGFGDSWSSFCRISFANVNVEELKEAFSRLRSYSLKSEAK